MWGHAVNQWHSQGWNSTIPGSKKRNTGDLQESNDILITNEGQLLLLRQPWHSSWIW